MSYNFLIVGGDMRNYMLADKLAKDKNKVKIYGFENIELELNENIEKVENIENIENVKDNYIIISAIPFSKDGENIYAPYSNKKIGINILKDKKIIAGGVKEATINKYNLKVNDIFKDEATIILNTIPTAEGAIQLAMEKTNYTLSSANVLILGFGRVGKILCNKLKGIGANVFAEARKNTDLAWIKAYGYNPVSLKDLKANVCKMDIIFNTIPEKILDKSTLILIHKESLIIDLASAPGGTDFESAQKLGIESILYSGIPGKVAPDDAAEYIKEYIYRTIEENEMYKI